MIALALDTSGPVGSVAVALMDDDAAPPRVVATVTIASGMRHGVELFPALERALREAGVAARDIDLVAVGTGPGSYTGLRVGVTAARALAYACGADLVGVPSCDALADAFPPADRPVAVVVDARVRAVYLAVYDPVGGADRWARRGGPELLEPGGAAGRLPADALLVGDGPDAHEQAFVGFARAASPRDAPAAHVARLGILRHRGGERTPIEDVVPLYLRKSSAELRHPEARSEGTGPAATGPAARGPGKATEKGGDA